jgi:hypothetical protein
VWGDLFAARVGDGADSQTLLEAIEHRFHESESAELHARVTNGDFPAAFSAVIVLPGDAASAKLTVTARGKWKIHRARMHAILLNGSYSFTERKFAGQIATPYVDIKSMDPGPGWEPIEEVPTSPFGVRMVIIRHHADVKGALVGALAAQPIAN